MADRRVLFLHGGPGMNAMLERQQFGDALPVHWWDQPLIRPGARRPFEALIEAVQAEVSRLSDERQGRIDVLANSFGAYLARALVERIPERIGAVAICGGVWDLSTAIVRLGSRLAGRYGDADLAAACRQAADAGSPELYLALLARVSAIPDFLDCYWSPAAVEQQEAMKALAAESRLIDWPTCQTIMVAALSAPQLPLGIAHPGGVRIILGRLDPYFDDSDIAAWKALWPSAIVEIVDAGHFPHLELPPAVWLPGGAG